MKTIQSKGPRPLAARGVLIGALCSASLVLFSSFAGADGPGGVGGAMAGGDTGSLPITTPGDPLDPSLMDQSFFLSGHPEVLTRARRGLTGTGAAVLWELTDNFAYLELLGDVQIVLDENILRQANIDMGVTPGMTGAGMLAALEFDDHITRPTFVPNLSNLTLPYMRMSNAHVFDSPLVLHTIQNRGERGRIEFSSRAGLLTIDQRLDRRLKL